MGVRLDLGGIGKGYTADEMLEAIRGFGISFRTAGHWGRCPMWRMLPPSEEGWVGGTEEMFRMRTIAVQSRWPIALISTSGDLQQFVEIDGRRYSHIVDPTTGLGLNDSLLATVVARNGLMADPLATAACVNPWFFRSELPPATEIHSRILSSQMEQVSRGFPTLAPNQADQPKKPQLMRLGSDG